MRYFDTWRRTIICVHKYFESLSELTVFKYHTLHGSPRMSTLLPIELQNLVGQKEKFLATKLLIVRTKRVKFVTRLEKEKKNLF